MTKNTIVKNLLIVFLPTKLIYTIIVFVYEIFIVRKKLSFIFLFFYMSVYGIILIYLITSYIRTCSNEETSTFYRFPYSQPNNESINITGINPYTQLEMKIKTKKSIRICRYCKTYKPARTEHCKTCNACFFKLDHHSSILGVCIHYYNYKFYLVFLISTFIIDCFHLSAEAIVYFIEGKLGLHDYIDIMIIIPYFFVGQYLLYYNFINLINNENTYEREAITNFLKGNMMDIDIFQEGPLSDNIEIFQANRKMVNPYNISKLENFKEVFGNSFFDWINFEFTSKGDGINFTKSEDFKS